MVLNHAGEQLLAGVESPLEAIEEATKSIKQLSQWGHSWLRVGASTTLCEDFLPPILQRLDREFSPLQVILESGDLPQLTTLLRSRRVDLILGVECPEISDLEAKVIFDDELLFALSDQHPWNRAQPLSKDDIRRQALILYRRSSQSAQMILRYLDESESCPSIQMEVGSMNAIKEMVKLNLGVSVLAPWVAEPELSRGCLKMRPMGTKPLRRRWTAAYLPSRRLGLVEERFLSLCRAHGSSLRRDRKDLPRAQPRNTDRAWQNPRQEG